MARAGNSPVKPVVLVVDDKPQVLDIARRLLETAGFLVHPAASGGEALAIYGERADEIDCVLLDLEMPDMSGETTYARLRRVRPDVRVIFTSGLDESDVGVAIAENENVGYVQKPYRLKTLRSLVLRTIGE